MTAKAQIASYKVVPQEMDELARKFSDEHLFMERNIFGKQNKLNQELQGKDKHLSHLADKITCFTRKL